MVELNNLTASRIDESFLKKIAETVLKGERKKLVDLSIALVKDSRIRELNRKYRKKNRITDVLSFGGSLGPKALFLGEVVICPGQVRKNAKKSGLQFKKELALVLIHGILHLLGHDHEGSRNKAEAMQKKEKIYLNKFF